MDLKGTINVLHQRKSAWLIMEVLLFYANIVGIVVLVIFSNLFKFHTIRDRCGAGGNLRYTQDFLKYIKEDCHYFTMSFSSILLLGATIMFTNTQNDIYGLDQQEDLFMASKDSLVLGRLILETITVLLMFFLTGVYSLKFCYVTFGISVLIQIPLTY